MEPTFIDRTNCTRVVPMEVLCLGCGRTGTDSMRVALEILGYNDCYHGYTPTLENPPDSKLWAKAMDAKFKGKGKPFGRKEWDALLGHCMAVTDIPCITFSEELIEAYPEAKVIMTKAPKGVDRWYQSVMETLVAHKEDKVKDFWAFWDAEIWIATKMIYDSFDYFYGGDFRKNGRKVYVEHAKKIEALVPKKQYLEFNVVDGWEPLCDFLGKPVPDVPFPSGNMPQAFYDRLAKTERRSRQKIVLRGIMIAATACAGVVLFKGGILSRLWNLW